MPTPLSISVPYHPGLALFVALAVPLASQHPNEGARLYGEPTPGTGGTAPVLWVNTTPRVGASTFAIEITDGKPNALAMSFLSAGPAALTLGGVKVHLDFATAIGIGPTRLDGTGSFGIPLGIPNSSALLGWTSYGQTFVADAGGAPLGVSASRGLRLRIKRSAMLFGGGSDLSRIDLTSGAVSKFGKNIGVAHDVSLSQSGLHLAFPHSFPTGTSIFNATTGTHLGTATQTAKRFPRRCTFHPDGLRLYVVNNGVSGSSQTIDALWATPGVFPKLFSPGIQLGSIFDALDIHFSSDGKVGYVGTRGTSGGGHQIKKYDTTPGSPKFHKEIGSALWLGRFGRAIALSPDDRLIATAPAVKSKSATLFLLDAKTMKRLKSVQPGFGPDVTQLVFGPHSRFLYAANGNHALQINVDISDPNFGRTRKYDEGITKFQGVAGIAVSDVGGRLYAIVGPSTFEYDVATGKRLRSWTLTSSSKIVYR
jgi:DNA-binding beta-propeller fold protein YncE